MISPGIGGRPPGAGGEAPAGDPVTSEAIAAAPTPTRRWEMTAQEHAMMVRFRRDYLELLDGRVAKIARLLESRQFEPTHVALLSLESSSAMIGLHDLAAVAKELRIRLERGLTGGLEPLLDQLGEHAAGARASLEDPAAP